MPHLKRFQCLTKQCTALASYECSYFFYYHYYVTLVGNTRAAEVIDIAWHKESDWHQQYCWFSLCPSVYPLVCTAQATYPLKRIIKVMERICIIGLVKRFVALENNYVMFLDTLVPRKKDLMSESDVLPCSNDPIAFIRGSRLKDCLFQ